MPCVADAAVKFGAMNPLARRALALSFACSRRNSSTATSLYRTLIAASRAFTPNHTHIKIVGLEKLEDSYSPERVPIEPLMHVTALELALNQNELAKGARTSLFYPSKLPQYLPNVRELIVQGVGIANLYRLCGELRNLIPSDMYRRHTPVGRCSLLRCK